MGEGVSTKALGAWGEAYVAEHLKSRGYVILATNWHCRFGELDIVAENDSFLAFVEVKLRKGAKFAPARCSVDRKKQDKLRITAELYLMEHPTQRQPRFDVAEVYAPYGTETKWPKLYYIENAFW